MQCSNSFIMMLCLVLQAQAGSAGINLPGVGGLPSEGILPGPRGHHHGRNPSQTPMQVDMMR